MGLQVAFLHGKQTTTLLLNFKQFLRISFCILKQPLINEKQGRLSYRMDFYH